MNMNAEKYECRFTLAVKTITSRGRCASSFRTVLPRKPHSTTTYGSRGRRHCMFVSGKRIAPTQRPLVHAYTKEDQQRNNVNKLKSAIRRFVSRGFSHGQAPICFWITLLAMMEQWTEPSLACFCDSYVTIRRPLFPPPLHL